MRSPRRRWSASSSPPQIAWRRSPGAQVGAPSTAAGGVGALRWCRRGPRAAPVCRRARPGAAPNSRGGGPIRAHPHCRAQAARRAGQAAHGHAGALDPRALWLPRRPQPPPRSPRRAGGPGRGSSDPGDLRPLPGRRGDAGRRGRSAEAALKQRGTLTPPGRGQWSRARAVESGEPAMEAAPSSLSGAGRRLPNVLPPGAPAPFAAAA